ncbi:outer membrane beta-barrel protein [Solitalea lacus]|uniref:outer membrane beta-barrel protein n=1 Tax=Solitalea lacus TaxID=2911172 RepID=UPI001EDB959B|nr:outer membrane beta-barrel protein [Solitalea lacus]UKJ06043.1 PorT family protein [Solitalea lacus]
MKTLRFTLLFVLAPMLILAQNYRYEQNVPIKIGFVGGYNLSRITNSQPSYTIDNYSGYSFGGSALWQKWGKTGMQADLFFSRQGYHYNEFGTADGYLISSYAYLTPSMNYKPISWASFFAGIQMGFLIKANCGCGNTENQSTITHHFNRFDYGLNGGIEFSAKSIADGFVLGLKYYYGLKNIVNESAAQSEEDLPITLPNFSTQNSVMNFYFGYRF